MTALDAAVRAIDDYCGDTLDDSKALVRAKCRALVRGYDARWRDAGYTALSVEQVYRSPLYDFDKDEPEKHRSRTFEIAGKIDVLALEHRKRTVIMDHKFTSSDFNDPNAPYWRQLAIEGQASHYQLLLQLNGVRVDGVVWDVIKRPTIAPKSITKAVRDSVVAERRYFGEPMGMATLDALQMVERETLEMYESRLLHDCTVERPDYYFQRRAVPRLDQHIAEYAQDLWQSAKMILASRKVKRLPKHSKACMAYNSPCQFLGICSGFDTADSDRWQKRESRHAELGEHGNIDALTNSRLQTYQLCPQKHRFIYELGIERQDQDTEALWSGSLLHAGLEAWWRTFLPQETINVDSSEAATSGASA